MSDLSGAMAVNTNKTQETKRKPIYFNQRINSTDNEIKRTLNNDNSGVSTPLMAHDKNGNIVPFNYGTSFDINESDFNVNDDFKYKKQKVDRRVSLTVRPRTYNVDDSSLMKRVNDILKTGIGNDLLFRVCEKSFGIIFPYTPSISGFGKTVNYDTIQIPHSNLAYNQYKNTNNNDIMLKAKFTADNRKNAFSMISAIWFLNACSSSKFGKNEGDDAGLPPPVLYLNGYHNMIDNIPVVISSFDYNLDDKSQYVNLVLNTFGNIENLPLKNDEKDDFFIGETCLSYWLPTELDITIKLKIQPNLSKVNDQWSLSKYKSGDLFLESKKNSSVSGKNYIPSGWTW